MSNLMTTITLQQIIVRCCVPRPSDKELAVIEADLPAIAGNLPELLRLAAVCRAAPLVAGRILQADNRGRGRILSAAQQNQLRRIVQANASRTAWLDCALADVMRLLTERGIYALAVKGPLLAHAAYDAPGLRQFDDLDIIVPPADLANARRVLERQKFSAIMEPPDYVARSRYNHPAHCILRSRDNFYDIDLHAGLRHDWFGFNIPFDILKEFRREVLLDGKPVPTLAPELLLPFLCAHGCRHLWRRPVWVADIAGILQWPDTSIDWESCIEIAARYDALRMLLIGVHLAAETYNVPEPVVLRKQQLADRAFEPLFRKIKLSALNAVGCPESDDLGRLQLHLQMKTRLRSKAAYLLRRGLRPTPNDWRTLRLPPVLYPLYYLLHPIRLAFTHLAPKQSADAADTADIADKS